MATAACKGGAVSTGPVTASKRAQMDRIGHDCPLSIAQFQLTTHNMSHTGWFWAAREQPLVIWRNLLLL